MGILREIEGTWENISALANEFKGHRLKVSILSQSEKQKEEKEISPQERVLKILRDWQSQDNTPVFMPPPNKDGLTPTQALFQQWAD